MNAEQMMARVRTKSGRESFAKYSVNDCVEDINQAIRRANDITENRGKDGFASFSGLAGTCNVFDLPVDFEAEKRVRLGRFSVDAVELSLLRMAEANGVNYNACGFAIDYAARKFYGFHSDFASAVSSLLVSPLSASADSCVINDVSGFENCGVVLIGIEKIRYHKAETAGGVITLYGLERGIEFSDAASHLAGSSVVQRNVELYYWARGLELLTVPDASDITCNVVGYDDCIDEGTHKYMLCFYDPATGRESVAASLPDVTITVHNTAVFFDDVPGDLWNDGSHKRLYRTKANTSYPFFLVPYDFNDEATTYTDIFTDAALGAQYDPYLASCDFAKDFHDGIVGMAIGFAMQGLKRFDEAEYWINRGDQAILTVHERLFGDKKTLVRVRGGW